MVPRCVEPTISGKSVEHRIEAGNNGLIQQTSFFCAMKENLMQFIPSEMPLDIEVETETASENPPIRPSQFRLDNPALSDRDLAYAYRRYPRVQMGGQGNVTGPKDDR